MSESETIAIVDDTEGTRFALRRTLERAGFEVLEGACGADAFRLAASKPGLMILDVHMPDLMGTEVSRRLKADPETRSIPILQLSASFTGELDRAAGLDCGADAYLTEPVDPQLLLATIHALLRTRSAERAAERALESQDAFLSITSHDIRNLLQGMQLALGLQLHKAQERHVDQQGLATALQRSIDDVTRMTRLVDDLLDSAQLKAGKVVLRREQLDLAAAVRNIVERWQRHFAGRAQVVVDAPAEVRGSFDLLRVNQIVVNLLANALKYGGDKPIHVRVAVDEQRAVIEVADEGPGIPPGDAERIFDRFDRGGASDRAGSYGLGLWIVRELARLHGGTAALVSGQGRGAVFRVTLPLPVAAAA